MLSRSLSPASRSGHVPSPAPGDPSLGPAVSPQRKLSVIPEVPGFSRPPSLAELAVAKHHQATTSSEQSPSLSTTATTRTSYFQPTPLPRSLHQHSIESSVVTEGHYDASFETEDPAASFDVEPANYQSYEACAYVEEPTILSNGHYKMSSQELNMLGMNQLTTTTPGVKASLETSKQAKVSSAGPVSDPVGASGGTKIPDGRKGEIVRLG